MRRKMISLVTLGLVALASSHANASTAITAQTLNTNNLGGSRYFGFDFIAPTGISVTSLGVYDAGATFTGPQTVVLFDVTTGTTVTSAVVTSFTANAFSYSGPISVQISSSDVYSVYTFLSGDEAFGTPSAVTYDPAIHNVNPDGSSNGTSGLFGGSAPPTTSYSGISTNFTFGPATVPEPASIAMMGLGLAGVVLARRKTCKHSA